VILRFPSISACAQQWTLHAVADWQLIMRSLKGKTRVISDALCTTGFVIAFRRLICVKGLGSHVGFILLVASLLSVVGCSEFRWGKRDNLDDVNSTKARESHYWRGFKPDRDLQDPLWTP
jgi:hypothetical protein